MVKEIILNIALILSLFLLNRCENPSGSIVEIIEKNDSIKKEFNFEIANQEMFDSLSSVPLTEKFSQVKSMKVIWALDDDSILFINSKAHRLHFDFIKKYINENENLTVFNSINYHTNFAQKYCLGILNYYVDGDFYTIEMTASSKYDVDQIEDFFERLKKKVYFGEKLKILISTDYLFEVAEKLSIPKIELNEILSNKNYQSIFDGRELGYLKMYDPKSTVDHSKDIIIVEGTPFFIPECKGVITTEFQTPLSHIQVLAHSRKIPCCVIRNILSNKEVIKLLGKPIALNVSSAEWNIKPTDALIETRSKGKTRDLSCDVEYLRIVDLQVLNESMTERVGSKAANLATLLRVQRDLGYDYFKVPESCYGIPFYYFEKHMKKSKVADELNAALKAHAEGDFKGVKKHLSKVRERIESTPVDDSLIASIGKLLNESPFESFRFRSSSNAEDLKGFSGAGLYESATYKKKHPIKRMDIAILKVWSSLYGEKAFLERRIHNMNEASVKMGVLIHRSFPSEVANGVAITSNLLRPDFTGMTVNLQKGESSVVEPDQGVQAEQVILLDAGRVVGGGLKLACDYVAMSSLSDNKPLLTKEEYLKLYTALDQLKRRLIELDFGNDRSSFDRYSIDVEFKFLDDGSLYFKQIRPY
ncbi:MAG: PEP/pyruvate-binding domain-containing protein [Flavobacteriales bacterium]|jgi:pyruvate,water dikinase